MAFLTLKSVNNRMRSGNGKQDRLQVTNRNKRNVTRSLVEKFTFYLVYNNFDHGKARRILDIIYSGKHRNQHKDALP